MCSSEFWNRVDMCKTREVAHERTHDVCRARRAARAVTLLLKTKNEGTDKFLCISRDQRYFRRWKMGGKCIFYVF
jgi:hypothetical protein